MKRLFSLSPTYTTTLPFGTSIDVEATCFPDEYDHRRMFLAFMIGGKRMAIAIYL